jgi:hypothetical protein
MTKLMFLVLGLLVVTATALMVSAAPDSVRMSDQMDIRALERTIDSNALPKGDLDPAVYQ